MRLFLSLEKFGIKKCSSTEKIIKSQNTNILQKSSHNQGTVRGFLTLFGTTTVLRFFNSSNVNEIVKTF